MQPYSWNKVDKEVVQNIAQHSTLFAQVFIDLCLHRIKFKEKKIIVIHI